jgi:hypothetical protein
MQFAVGFKVHGKTGHVVVDGEDALIAALKVKMERPDARITYVPQQAGRFAASDEWPRRGGGLILSALVSGQIADALCSVRCGPLTSI